MQSNEITSGILKAGAVLFGIFVLFWFLYKIQSILVYIALSVVVTLIIRPLVNFLIRRLKFRNTPAVITAMLLTLGCIAGLLMLFVPLIRQQSRNLSLLNIDYLKETAENLYREALIFLSGSGVDVEAQLHSPTFLDNLNFSFIPELVNSLFGFLGDFSIGLFSVIFISFFLLKDHRLLEKGILAFIPDDKELQVIGAINKIKSLLSRYFIGLVFQVVVLFIFYSAVLLIFKIENAFIIAFLCALLNIIPYIGPIIGGVMMAFLSMSSNVEQDFSSVILPTTIYVMIGFGIGQLIDNFISQPLIFSKSVRSHPLEIFLVIITGGLLFGVAGMIAAVPAYTAIKVVARQFLYDLKVVRQLTENM